MISRTTPVCSIRSTSERIPDTPIVLSTVQVQWKLPLHISYPKAMGDQKNSAPAITSNDLSSASPSMVLPLYQMVTTTKSHLLNFSF